VLIKSLCKSLNQSKFFLMNDSTQKHKDCPCGTAMVLLSLDNSYYQLLKEFEIDDSKINCILKDSELEELWLSLTTIKEAAEWKRKRQCLQQFLWSVALTTKAITGALDCKEWWYIMAERLTNLVSLDAWIKYNKISYEENERENAQLKTIVKGVPVYATLISIQLLHFANSLSSKKNYFDVVKEALTVQTNLDIRNGGLSKFYKNTV